MTLAASAVAPLEKVPVSPEPIYRLLFGRSMTQILLVAHELGIFEALKDEPRTLSDLCAQLGLPRHSAEMVVNTCVAIGLLQKEEDAYRNSLLTRHYLIQGGPFYLGGLIAHFTSQVFPAWDHLKEAVVEDGPQMGKHFSAGKSDIFQVTDQEDRETELFIEAMHNLSISDGLLLADVFDFSGYKQLVDVGGGSGALSIALASRFPGLRATIFDRPQVCVLADRHIRQAGLDERVGTMGGDAFADPLPPKTDVFLLSLFIHAFGIEKSTPILKKCWDALPPGGCVLIYEPMLDPARTGPMTTLLSSLNMLVVTPSGGDTTAEDYQRWLERIGFERIFYKPAAGVRHLVGGYKPRRSIP